MKTKKILSITLLLLLGTLTIVGAQKEQTAPDALWQPAPPMLFTLTGAQQNMTTYAPDGATIQDILRYAAWYNQGTEIPTTVKSNCSCYYVSKGALSNQKMIKHMKNRLEFFKESHNWNKDSYAYLALKNMIQDYERAFLPRSNFSAMDMQQTLITIERYHMQNVELSEVRSYANEIIRFAIRRTMEEKNLN